MFFSSDQSKYRLGELLVEKKLITSDQLQEAVDLQQQEEDKKLGQILIEYGYLTSRQLGKALRKQNRLRKLAYIVAFCTFGTMGLSGMAHAKKPTQSSGEEMVRLKGWEKKQLSTGDSVTEEPVLEEPTPDPIIEEPVPEPEPIVTEPTPDTVVDTTPILQNAVVSWSHPTQREDGSELVIDELSGYEIHYMAESTGNIEVITVNDSTSTSFTINELPPDIYHFSIVAMDVHGLASSMSEPVTVSVEKI